MNNKGLTREEFEKLQMESAAWIREKLDLPPMDKKTEATLKRRINFFFKQELARKLMK